MSTILVPSAYYTIENNTWEEITFTSPMTVVENPPVEPAPATEPKPEPKVEPKPEPKPEPKTETQSKPETTVDTIKAIESETPLERKLALIDTRFYSINDDIKKLRTDAQNDLRTIHSSIVGAGILAAFTLFLLMVGFGMTESKLNTLIQRGEPQTPQTQAPKENANKLTVEYDVTYLGCYSDNPRKRALPKMLKDQSTFKECAWLARRAGYSLFSIQHTTHECWAGNNLSDAAEYGKSDKCVFLEPPGRLRGGPSTNAIYSIIGSNGDDKNLPRISTTASTTSSTTENLPRSIGECHTIPKETEKQKEERKDREWIEAYYHDMVQRQTNKLPDYAPIKREGGHFSVFDEDQ